MSRARAAGIVALAVAGGFGQTPAAAPAAPLSSSQQIVQAINRLTWGSEPGEVAAVEKVGLQQWIRQQLHPDQIPENPVLTAMLAPLEALRMSPAETLAHYPSAALIRQMENGRLPLPSDATLRGVVEAEIAADRARAVAKKDAQTDGAAKSGGLAPAPGLAQVQPDAPVVWSAPALATLLTPDQVQSVTSGPVRDRVAALEGLPDSVRARVLQSLPRREANPLLVWLPADQARAINYYLRPQQIVSNDLMDGKILRAVYSNRQLEDVLADFWFNHFNVNIRKGPEREMLASYLREAIRPHVLGSFHDLLLATAESPAMLFYLDNWQSRAGQINENYGREVMELHTVGLQYTQADVTAAARCFTGWTIRQPQRQAEFFYNDKMHDKGEKVVLGHTIPAGGGMSDGLAVLDLLSRSPATAHHIAYELAQRFVADDPPPALVDRMAATFNRTGGDLRQVMQTMIASPEFWSPQYFRDKVKSPLEMVVSSVRSLGADVSNPMRLAQAVGAMGEPLFAKEPPTGYLNTGDEWVSSSGLVNRMKFATALAANQIPGVQVDTSQFEGATADSLAAALLASPPQAATLAAIQGHAHTPVQMAALLLGSPDFQKH